MVSFADFPVCAICGVSHRFVYNVAETDDDTPVYRCGDCIDAVHALAPALHAPASWTQIVAEVTTPDDRPEGMTIAEYHHGIGADVAGNVLHAVRTLQDRACVSFAGIRTTTPEDRRAEITGAVYLAVDALDACALDGDTPFPTGGTLDNVMGEAWAACGRIRHETDAEEIADVYTLHADRAERIAHDFRMLAEQERHAITGHAVAMAVSRASAYGMAIDRADDATFSAITLHGAADTMRAGATMIRAYC